VIGGAKAPLARAWNSAYLGTMSPPLSAQESMLPAAAPKGRAATLIIWGAAALAALMVAAAGVLWVHYGTAVFFEMIAAGIAACF
jgi:hypothetical protein